MISHDGSVKPQTKVIIDYGRRCGQDLRVEIVQAISAFVRAGIILLTVDDSWKVM